MKVPALSVRGRSIPGRVVIGSGVAGVAVVGVLVAALVASGMPAAQPSPSPSDVAVIPSASPSPSPTPTPTASPSVAPTPAPSGPVADALLGTDGRFTVLLLGSDYRPAHPGNRTDAIMVVSIDPATGDAAGFSIPRDTSRFPLPSGKVYGAKINGLFASLGKGGASGGVAMKRVIGSALGIEIDRYAFIGFAGVQQLVAAVGGVDVHLDKPYYDAYYWVNAHRRGWGLPAGTSHLGPTDALIFARSRKGDNDFGRARRQQLLVLAALEKVRARGGRDIPKLLAIAAKTVRTDLPLDRAPDLYKLLATTDVGAVKRVVFGPSTYASSIGGTSFALNIARCKAWIAENFPAAKPFAAWPPVVASPSPSAAPAASGATSGSASPGASAP